MEARNTKRVALRPHTAMIRQWVEEGRSDEWIARELNTTPSSVQSFRSRHSIYRQDPVRRVSLSEHPAIMDETKEGVVVRTETPGSEMFDKEWRSYLGGSPDALRMVITRERIYVEKVR